MVSQLRSSRLVAIITILTLAACSSGDSTDPDGGGGGGGGGGGNPTISLQLSTTSINLVPGAGVDADIGVQEAGVTLTATITRGGDFSGSVAIAVTGASQGVTATATPATIPSNATTSTIDVRAAGDAPAGNRTLTVTASGTGVSSVSQTLQVVVAAVDPGGFALAVSPTTVSVQQGQQATSTVNITRTSPFTGAVALSATAPTGLTATLNPTSATGATSTLTIAASGSVMPGMYTVAIAGTGTGVANQMTSLGVTVTSSGGGGGGNVTFSYCANKIPTWVAYQDGNGAWMQATPVGSTFTFPINSGTGGVAIVDASTGSNLEVYYGTVAELNGIGMRCGSSTAPTKTLMGSVAGLGATDQGWVNLGGASATVSGFGSPNYTLMNVLDGPHDLVASQTSLVVQGQTVTTQLLKLIIRRLLNLPNGSTIPLLDFNSSEAFAPVQRNLTIDNLGTDMALINGSLITSGTGFATLYTEVGMTAGSARQYYGLPNANRASGDLHFLNVTAVSGTSTITARSVGLYFAEALDKTAPLGPPITGVNVSTAATTPYARMRATYMVQPEYDDFIFFGGSQASGNRSFFIYASKSYRGGATMFDFALPDFSSVSGWMNTWAPQTGISTAWSFGGFGFSVPGGLFVPFADGVISQNAITSGTITP